MTRTNHSINSNDQLIVRSYLDFKCASIKKLEEIVISNSMTIAMVDKDTKGFYAFKVKPNNYDKPVINSCNQHGSQISSIYIKTPSVYYANLGQGERFSANIERDGWIINLGSQRESYAPFTQISNENLKRGVYRVTSFYLLEIIDRTINNPKKFLNQLNEALT